MGEGESLEGESPLETQLLWSFESEKVAGAAMEGKKKEGERERVCRKPQREKREREGEERERVAGGRKSSRERGRLDSNFHAARSLKEKGLGTWFTTLKILLWQNN